jgi:hypothetical protein
MADTNVTQVKIAGQALKTFTAATGVVAQDRKLSVILTSTHASFVPGCNVTVVAGTDQNTSVNDETTLSPAGLTWTSAQALKADALLVLQSE